MNIKNWNKGYTKQIKYTKENYSNKQKIKKLRKNINKYKSIFKKFPYELWRILIKFKKCKLTLQKKAK